MMHRIFGLLSFVVAGLALSSPDSQAGSAEICYGPVEDVSLCGTASGCELPSNTTLFTCATAGTHTLPELAAQGWVVVQLLQRTRSAPPQGGSQGTQVEQIVIQKP